MLVGGNKRNSNDPLKNTLFYPLDSASVPDPLPTCLNGAKLEIDGNAREFTALFPNAGKTTTCFFLRAQTEVKLPKVSKFAEVGIPWLSTLSAKNPVNIISA